ncbi:MAG: BamA/TamA family outer membrane protein, partial [Acidobacteriota bacterium]|nr:BamA/TamA family outer membrane protein [Acidobacteriota bacterium]
RDVGLPDVVVDYRVRLDTASNAVDVTFVVQEGLPLTIGSVRAELVDSAEAERWPPEELRPSWERHVAELDGEQGRRFGALARSRMQTRLTSWLQDHGYPWGRTSIVRADTVDTTVDVVLGVTPGPRARVDTVLIEGHDRLSLDVVRREIPIERGEWYDRSAQAAGEREVFELDVVRRALSDVPDGQPVDSTVSVRYRLDEGLPRLVWGRIGYRTVAGVSAEGHWVHRDFLGGARSLTVSGVAETGIGGLEEIRTRRFGASVALLQPFLWDRRLSLTLSPFGRFRDDFRDRSVELGVETALLYQWDAFRHVSLRHEIGRREIRDVVQLIPVAERVASGDSAYAPSFVTQSIRLVGSYGRLDDRLAPESGYLIRPSLEVSGPLGSSDVEYVRGAVEGIAALPLWSGFGLFLRASAGRLVPFGDSDPTEGEPRTRALAGLRGVLFTAGGIGDVRGWSRELLGSKVPDVSSDAGNPPIADRYLPAGGLARISGHIELVMPFPGLAEEHRTFVFSDGGR